MGRKRKELSGKDAALGTIAAGGLAQLSRNKKVNNLGELGIVFGLMVLVSEVIKGFFKWCIWKPCVFIAKFIYKFFKLALIAGIKIYYELFKWIMKLCKLIKNKMISEKAV